MWPKYLSLATFMYNTLNSPTLVNFSPSGKSKILLNLETMPDIKISGTFKDYNELLSKKLKYLHEVLQNFKSKRIALINKDRTFFQYNSGDLV